MEIGAKISKQSDDVKSRFFDNISLFYKVALIVHLGLSIVFISLKLHWLAYFNLFYSVPTYVLALVLLRKGANAKKFGFYLGVIELILHQVISTSFLGWQSGFINYLALLFILPNYYINLQRRYKIALGLTGIAFIITLIISNNVPSYNLDESVKILFSIFNLLCPFFIVGIITHQLLLANQKIESHLQQLLREKERLLAVIAHDIKGPINSFHGLFQLLDANAVTPLEFSNLKTSISDRFVAIEKTLCEVTEWASFKIQKETCSQKIIINVHKLFVNCLDVYKTHIEKKKVEIELSIKRGEYVYGDAAQLGLIIRNLLSNAIKFSNEGGTILICCESKQSNTIISIKDYGVGISQETLKSNEFQSRRGTAGEYGNGIGLMLSKELIAANGGQIWYESILGKGTTVYLSFQSPKNKLLHMLSERGVRHKHKL
jgi:signal transduction histidine kinase